MQLSLISFGPCGPGTVSVSWLVTWCTDGLLNRTICEGAAKNCFGKKKRTNNGRWLVKPSVYHHLSQVKFTFGCKRTTYWLSDLKTHVAASSSSKDAHRSEHRRFRHENTTWRMSRWIFEIMWLHDLPKPNVLQGNSHRKLTSSPMLPEPRSALSVSLWIHICSDNKDQVSITSAAITDWILLIQQVSISDMPVSFHALPLSEECKNKSYKPPRHLV